MDDGIRARGGPGSAPFGDMQANVVADMGLGGRDIDALSSAWTVNATACTQLLLFPPKRDVLAGLRLHINGVVVLAGQHARHREGDAGGRRLPGADVY